MFACTGKRNVTAFVQKKNFKEVDFRRDIHFLETAQREIDLNIQAAHSVLRKNVLSEHQRSDSKQNEKLKKLRYVLKKSNIELLLLPSSFERHMRNKSRCGKTGTIHWSIEVQGQNINHNIYHNICAENTWLVELKKLGLEIDENVLLKLKDFSSSTARRMNSFVDLDVNSKILDSLKGKTILEFPTVQIDSWAGGVSKPVKNDDEPAKTEKIIAKTES